MSFKPGHRLNVRHGLSGTPAHRSWTAMIGRCRTSSDGSFPDYGGRGIAVCDRWLVFENFLSDMGPRPPGMSLDRIDVAGNYEPGNCRWATDIQQRRNKRCTIVSSHQPRQIRWLAESGMTHREIAEVFGVNREAVSKIVRNERWADPSYQYVRRRASPKALP